MPLYLRSVTSQGARPTLSPFDVFTFRLVVESIKEFEGVSILATHMHNMWSNLNEFC